MGDARYMYTAGIPAVRVGSLLARARIAAGIADRDLAAAIRVPWRTVRQWEQGELVPNDDQIEAIADACGTRLTELLPNRTAVSYDAITGTLQMGRQSVTLPPNRDNDAVLGAFIGLVRRQRGLRMDQDVRIRYEDVDALGAALDLNDDELEERLVRVIGLSRQQAAAVKAQLLRRRLAVPVVGMLAGLSLLGLNRLFTTGTEQVRTVAGGQVVRGDPFLSSTTVPTASTTSTTAAVLATSVVVTTPSSAAAPDLTTAATPPPTLPAIVMAEVLAVPGMPPEMRTGPPRTTPRRVGGQPTTPGATTDPGTATNAATPPPTSPVTTSHTAPPVTATTPTTQPPATQPPPTEPPVTTPVSVPTSGPVVTTIGGGGTSGTTEPPPPPTTTTTQAPPPPTDPPVTTTAAPPPTDPPVTTTAAPPTTTTEAPPPPPPVGGNPNTVADVTGGGTS